MMHRESAEHLIGLSDRATAPAEMLPVTIPIGTILYDQNPVSEVFGVHGLFHGRIRTFAEPNDYADGSLIIFRRGQADFMQVHITRRDLSPDEINQAGQVAEAIVNNRYQTEAARRAKTGMIVSEVDLSTLDISLGDAQNALEQAQIGLEVQRQNLIRQADNMGIVLISDPLNGGYSPVRLAAKKLPPVSSPLPRPLTLETYEIFNAGRVLPQPERPVRDPESQQAYEYAREFLRLWNLPEARLEDQQALAELLNHTYLSPFGKFFILHAYTERIIGGSSTEYDLAGREIRIDLQKESYGAFDISADMAAIEKSLMKPVIQPFFDEEKGQIQGTDEQKAYILSWQTEYENRYHAAAPCREKLKEKRQIHEAVGHLPKAVTHWLATEAYDANATWGHIINIVVSAVGMNVFLKLIGQEDIITRLGLAGGLLALALIGSFNLPNRSMDPSEKVSLRVLTFSPTIAMGMLAGVIVKDFWQAVAVTPMVATFAASGIAYWKVGPMSRNFEFQKLQQAGVFTRYPNLGDFAARVKAGQNHVAFDKIAKLLTTSRNYWQIVPLVRDAASLIDAGEAEIKKFLGDIRKYLQINPVEITY